jgi:hypothetical protein
MHTFPFELDVFFFSNLESILSISKYYEYVFDSLGTYLESMGEKM